MRSAWASVGLCILILTFVVLWKDDAKVGYTELAAREQAEKIFHSFLADEGMKRADFGTAIVELTNGDVLVSFKSVSTPGESVVITLGKDGSQGIAPLLPSHDFPR